uniref:30S ribosomal protein S3, chloroplastic n=1 Tax=Tanacetum cinerariifolium TaxID=118510 RepID=A0A699IKE0_TANCI|nr:40S ribosomal protein S3-1-like [Tanacetum cinerariifolium]
MATQLSKKRKFVADGVFFAELNEVLMRELAEDGYSGVEVRVTPMRTEIIIRATRTQNVLGEKGRRIRELTSLVQKRFKFPENSVELYAERVNNRGLCAIAQAESLRYKLLGGLAVRRACNGVLRFVMENGAKGCEVIISGKLRAQRAKSMKFKDGYMISSGQPVKEYIDSAVRHVLLRQGVLGIKVKIMLDWDPTGKVGPKTPLPDNVVIHMPKDDIVAQPPKEMEEYRPPLVAADEPLPMPIQFLSEQSLLTTAGTCFAFVFYRSIMFEELKSCTLLRIQFLWCLRQCFTQQKTCLGQDGVYGTHGSVPQPTSSSAKGKSKTQNKQTGSQLNETQSQPIDGGNQSQNVAPRKKMVNKTKNKVATKKQGEAQTQVGGAQIHIEVQINVGGAQSQTQVNAIVREAQTRASVSVVQATGGVQASSGSYHLTSPKWTRKQIATSRMMGSP